MVVDQIFLCYFKFLNYEDGRLDITGGRLEITKDLGGGLDICR